MTHECQDYLDADLMGAVIIEVCPGSSSHLSLNLPVRVTPAMGGVVWNHEGIMTMYICNHASRSGFASHCVSRLFTPQVDPSGSITKFLMDPDGSRVAFVSAAVEVDTDASLHGHRLFLGSLARQYVSYVDMDLLNAGHGTNTAAA